MEILTRSEAISRGEGKYFTGIPCKNNHLTYRYTRSGSCANCVRQATAPIEDQQKRKEVRSHIAEMVTFRARVYAEDLALFRSIVLGTTQIQEPAVTLSDVWKSPKGTGHACNSAVYTFGAFARDVEMLQKAAYAIFTSHPVVFHQPKLPPIPDPEWPSGDPQ